MHKGKTQKIVEDKGVKRKVVAFVLRRNMGGGVALLLHSFLTNPALPMRLVGGGVEDGETVEQALWRELAEETGLTDVKLMRKLGVQQYFKPYIQANVERHDFLLWVGEKTDTMLSAFSQHKVQGSGADAGDTFGLHWLEVHALATTSIDDEHRPFITPDYLPELFLE